jgi:hypothetical protein
MRRIRHLWPAVVAITVAIGTPAFAQARHESRAAESDRAQARNDGARSDARARPRSARAVPGDQARGRAIAREHDAVRAPDARAIPPSQTYGSRTYAVPRAYAAPRGYTAPRAYVAPHAYGYYEHAYFGVPVVRYPHAYYTFRPRFPIGVGVYIGYPVAYPIAYGYPRYVYGYPYRGYGAAGYGYDGYPSPGTYGGISFDIAPDDSAVWVDGQYAGVAREFSPWYQPLTLTPGRHRIELQAPGRPPLMFDVDIIPGEVLPYRGTL